MIQHYPHPSLIGYDFHLKASPTFNGIRIRKRVRKKGFISDKENIKKPTKSVSFLTDSWFNLSDSNSTAGVLAGTISREEVSIQPLTITLQGSSSRSCTTPFGMFGASVDELQAAMLADCRPLTNSEKKLCKSSKITKVTP